MYKIILPFRYLFKKRITYLAVLSVALCVFVVIIVMTVLSGLVDEFKEENHRLVGDCVISSPSLVGFPYYAEFTEQLEADDFVQAVSPVIKSYGLLTVTAEGGIDLVRNAAVEVMGIDPARHSRVTGFGRWLYYNRLDPARAFEPAYAPDRPGCVPGIGVFRSPDSKGRFIHAQAPERASFSLSCFPLTSGGALAKAGAGLASTKTFYYSDDTHSGSAQADWGLIYVPFTQAQILCGMASSPMRVNAIYVKFKPEIKVETGCQKTNLLWNSFIEKHKAKKSAGLLGKVTVQSWKDYKRSIIAPMETEQTMMTIVFTMLGVITVFIVFAVFYMIVSHKSKDIGVMKSLGVSGFNVARVFLNFAFLVGLFGSTIGLICGVGFLLKINEIEGWLFTKFGFQLWDRSVYAIGDIPNKIDVEVLAVIIISAVAASLAGAVLPSIQASRRSCVETLQVNQL